MSVKTYDLESSVDYTGRRWLWRGTYPAATRYLEGVTTVARGEEFSLTGMAGNYGRSFFFRLKEDPDGIVTGPLDVNIFHRKVRRGSYNFMHYDLNTKAIRGQYAEIYAVSFGDSNYPEVDSLPDVVARTRAMVSSRFLDKHNKSRQLLTAALAAEGGKTVQLITGYVNDAVGLFRGSAANLESYMLKGARRFQRRRPRPREYAEFMRELADRSAEEWLKLQFGLNPLIDDLIGAARAANMSHKRLTERRKLYAVETYESIGQRSTVSQISSYGEVMANVAQTYSNTCTMKYMSSYVMDDTVATVAGLSHRDMPATLYELLPWSWLADYFTNAGSVVDFFGQFYGTSTSFQETVVSSTTKRTRMSPYYVSDPKKYRVITAQLRQASGFEHQRSITRAERFELPIPPLVVNVDLSPFRQSMLAAVAWQLQKKVRLDKLQSWLLKSG